MPGISTCCWRSPPSVPVYSKHRRGLGRRRGSQRHLVRGLSISASPSPSFSPSHSLSVFMCSEEPRLQGDLRCVYYLFIDCHVYCRSSDLIPCSRVQLQWHSWDPTQHPFVHESASFTTYFQASLSPLLSHHLCLCFLIISL